jgi:hypothetical protein
MRQPAQQFNALKRQAMTSRAQTRLNLRGRADELHAVRPIVLAMPLITLAAVLLVTGLTFPY